MGTLSAFYYKTPDKTPLFLVHATTMVGGFYPADFRFPVDPVDKNLAPYPYILDGNGKYGVGACK